jgi:pimeloyl-ACP methyl ester carboxylesterase
MEACYFGTDSHRLYGVVPDAADSAQTALVFCPPFAEEMVTTYARFASWGKQLEAEGIPVVRFHPFGTGESGGSFGDFTLTSAVSDACCAAELARHRVSPSRLGYFGLRLGATIAMLAACRQPVDLLVLWSPITSMSQYVRDLFRAQLTKEMVHQGATRVRHNTKDMIAELESEQQVDLMGYEFSPQLYREMDAAGKWPETPPARHVIWLARPAEEKSATAIVDQWKKSGSRIDFAVLPEPAFWEEFGSRFADRFAARTLEWLKQTAETR